MRSRALTVFCGVLTPAVAGNILWTLWTILIPDATTPPPSYYEFIAAELPYLVLLAMLAVYLGFDYLLIMSTKGDEFPRTTVVFEFLHLTALSAVTIAVAANKAWVAPLIAIYILLILAGNFCKAWVLGEGASRTLIIMGDFIGLGILRFGQDLGLSGGWHIPASLALPFLIWWWNARPPLQDYQP